MKKKFPFSLFSYFLIAAWSIKFWPFCFCCVFFLFLLVLFLHYDLLCFSLFLSLLIFSWYIYMCVCVCVGVCIYVCILCWLLLFIVFWGFWVIGLALNPLLMAGLICFLICFGKENFETFQSSYVWWWVDERCFHFLNNRWTMACAFGACILTIFIFKFLGDLDLFNQNNPDPVTVLMNGVLGGKREFWDFI